MALLLGIDLGTSSVKAVLFDSDAGRVVGVAAREYPILKPAPDRAEQNPDDWWQAAAQAVREVVGTGADVAGIGFSGQMHGGPLLDASLNPVQPAIIWADQRSAAEVGELIAQVGAETYGAVAGTLPAAGFMGPTLRWLAKHNPQVIDRTSRIILPKDYVRLKMTGEAATDVSDAAGTGLFDVTRKQWSAVLIEATGWPVSVFPPVLESAQQAGELTPAAAEMLGLRAGIPIVAGCSDQPAQALGNGLIEPGKASVTTGSGGQVFTPLRIDGDRVPTDPRLHVFNHAVPGTWYILGAILAAGLGLRWLRGLVSLDTLPNAYALMSEEVALVPPGADGLIYLPYLYGERTPHMDPLARGAFIGLGYHHTRGHLARAIMEGVAFALRESLEISLQLGGAVEMIIAAGGGSESDVWRQIQADVFGIPLRQTLLSEQAGLGAALLAGIGVGIYGSHAEACQQVVRYGPVTEPNPARQRFYEERYQQYRGLYATLRDDFHQLSRSAPPTT